MLLKQAIVFSPVCLCVCLISNYCNLVGMCCGAPAGDHLSLKYDLGPWPLEKIADNFNI